MKRNAHLDIKITCRWCGATSDEPENGENGPICPNCKQRVHTRETIHQ